MSSAVAFRSGVPLPGGWRVSRVLLEAWDAMVARIELRKGARRAPLIMTVDVDIKNKLLIGKLPIGFDRELMAPRLVRMVTSRCQHEKQRAAAAAASNT